MFTTVYQLHFGINLTYAIMAAQWGYTPVNMSYHKFYFTVKIFCTFILQAYDLPFVNEKEAANPLSFAKEKEER